MLEPGTILHGRYVVKESINQGAAANVYLGHLVHQAEAVAIKELIVVAATDDERDRTLQRFEEEAKVLASLDHPNLVRIRDHFRWHNRAILVRDYVEGGTLGQLLTRTMGFLPMASVQRLFKQICDGLEACHRNTPPVLFGDLKPDNVLIDPEGHVKLVGLGIVASSRPADATTTSLFQGTSTHGFAAIEQFMPNPRVDAATDIYALGAILYAMVTRKTPPSAIELAAGQARLESPVSINPKVPPLFASLIGKMMQQAQSARHQTIEEVRHHLDEISHPQPSEGLGDETSPGPGAAIVAADKAVGAWQQKRKCPHCGADGTTEVCANCGRHRRRRGGSAPHPHADAPGRLEAPPPETVTVVDFRNVPTDLLPAPVEVKALVQVPQGFLQYLTSKGAEHEEAYVQRINGTAVRFGAIREYPVGTILLMRLVVPVLTAREHQLIDTKVVITETGAVNNDLRTYTADFKGLPPKAKHLLDNLKSQERRCARRFGAGFQILSKALPNHRAVTLDVSATGLGFVSSRPMFLNDVIELVVNLDGPPPAEATLMVRIVSSTPVADKEHRIGVRFESLSEQSALILRQVLHKMAQ